MTTRILPYLVGNPYKPSFATVTGWGVDQSHSEVIVPANQWLEDDTSFWVSAYFQGRLLLVSGRFLWKPRFKGERFSIMNWWWRRADFILLNFKVVSTHRTGTHPEQPLPTGYKGIPFMLGERGIADWVCEGLGVWHVASFGSIVGRFQNLPLDCH